MEKEKNSEDDRRPPAPAPAPALGEITLEEFLNNISATDEDNAIISGTGRGGGGVDFDSSQQHNASLQAHLMQYQLHQNQQNNNSIMMMPAGFMARCVAQQAVPVAVNSVSDAAAARYSQEAMVSSANVVVEETEEKKKYKRKLRNRESAAESRARKKAYIEDLEEKLSRLQQENARLKRELDRQRSAPLHNRKQQLRRTRSSHL